MPFGSEGLVVTWVGPAPAEGRVRITDGWAFDKVGSLMDGRTSTRPAQREKASVLKTPRQQLEKYDRNVRRSEVFNASMAWDLETFVGWQERHGVEMEDRFLEIFKMYLERGNALFMSLVEHPDVINPQEFTRCSIVFQRGVIFYRNGREDLFLRSHFHSSNGDQDESVNFVPEGTVQMSFKTDSVWFPLALTEGIPEPSAEVVLDIVSDTALSSRDVPQPFEVLDVSRVGVGLDRLDVTRIAGTIQSAESVEDLRLSLRKKVH